MILSSWIEKFFTPLNIYRDRDYILYQKARLIYCLCLIMDIFLIILLINTFFVSQDTQPIITITYIAALLVNFGCLVLLVKGCYTLSTNILLIASFISIWLVMFLHNRTYFIYNLDSYFYILAGLAAVPFIVKNRFLSLIYFLFNELILIFFVIWKTSSFSSFSEFSVEYLLDASFAGSFVFLLSYLSYLIYQGAIAKADREIRLNITLRRELEEKARLELAQANKIVEQTSRLAEKAESASGAIHNIGNLLNNAGMATSVIRQIIKNSKMAGITRVTNLLEEHQTELGLLFQSEKGRNIFPYLKLLSSYYKEEKREINNQVNRLAELINHMGDVIRLQQSLGRIHSMEEFASIDAVIKDALLMEQELINQYAIDVSFIPSCLPDGYFDKYRILQILINLIRNAGFALSKTRQAEKKLKIVVKRIGLERITLEFRDNGPGIAEENLDKIFSFGFTTKKEGHGFGLHFSAHSAAEMGGVLKVKNNENGKGATFTLELPFRQE